MTKVIENIWILDIILMMKIIEMNVLSGVVTIERSSSYSSNNGRTNVFTVSLIPQHCLLFMAPVQPRQTMHCALPHRWYSPIPSPRCRLPEPCASPPNPLCSTREGRKRVALLVIGGRLGVGGGF